MTAAFMTVAAAAGFCSGVLYSARGLGTGARPVGLLAHALRGEIAGRVPGDAALVEARVDPDDVRVATGQGQHAPASASDQDARALALG